MKANYQETTWEATLTGKGKTLVQVGRGQFIFGRKTASEELDMKPSTVDKRMKKLEKLGNLNIKSNNHYSIITVVNWPSYQDEGEKGTGKVAGKEQASNTNKNVKNEKKEERIVNDKEGDCVGLGREGFDSFKNKFRDAWNLFATENNLLPIKVLTKGREAKLLARYQEEIFREKYHEIFNQIEHSPFLLGVSDKEWRVNFDWLIENDTNYVRVLEGFYKNYKPEVEDDGEIA
jgi:hypothetical protein